MTILPASEMFHRISRVTSCIPVLLLRGFCVSFGFRSQVSRGDVRRDERENLRRGADVGATHASPILLGRNGKKYGRAERRYPSNAGEGNRGPRVR